MKVQIQALPQNIQAYEFEKIEQNDQFTLKFKIIDKTDIIDVNHD